MNELISLNGVMRPAGEAYLGALSQAALYGRGVFTTVRITRGEAFLWARHWRRLAANAAAAGIDISGIAEPDASAWLAQIIAANEISEGVARITLFDESPTVMWPYAASGGTSMSIMTRERRPVPPHLRLTVSPYALNSSSPLAGVKSCNYLENLIAAEEARGRGFDEAIRVNERGGVAGGCMSNIFWLRSGKLYTPPLASGCLAGTTREFVMESFDCIESAAGIEALREADSIYLTSAGLGVAAVKEFDGRPLGATDHPILALIPVS